MISNAVMYTALCLFNSHHFYWSDAENKALNTCVILQQIGRGRSYQETFNIHLFYYP